MVPAIVVTTIQAACLSMLSNLLAQVFKAYRLKKPFKLNITPILEFGVFTCLSCPPNILWQEFIERKFPAYTLNYRGEMSLDTVNTAKKFLLDQTIGAMANTVIFIAGIGALRGKKRHAIVKDVDDDFWKLVKSGWKLWPMVSLANFVLVPVEMRVLVGSVIGLFWGIYLSLFVDKNEPLLPTKPGQAHIS